MEEQDAHFDQNVKDLLIAMSDVFNRTNNNWRQHIEAFKYFRGHWLLTHLLKRIYDE